MNVYMQMAIMFAVMAVIQTLLQFFIKALGPGVAKRMMLGVPNLSVRSIGFWAGPLSFASTALVLVVIGRLSP
jgi:hypothetical protein